jgi:hypothetical protein
VRLHQHPDFAAFVTATSAGHHLREPFVEKDYWITEILRTIATTLPDRAIFKGGTGLAKGRGLLDRFSEDVDLFGGATSCCPKRCPAGPKLSVHGTQNPFNDERPGFPGLSYIAEGGIRTCDLRVMRRISELFCAYCR